MRLQAPDDRLQDGVEDEQRDRSAGLRSDGAAQAASVRLEPFVATL
jgi:hypothetical protein